MYRRGRCVPIFGNVIAAGNAVGVFPDLADTIRELIPVKEIIEPRTEWKTVYDDLYHIYLNMFSHLDNDLIELSGL